MITPGFRRAAAAACSLLLRLAVIFPEARGHAGTCGHAVICSHAGVCARTGTCARAGACGLKGLLRPGLRNLAVLVMCLPLLYGCASDSGHGSAGAGFTYGTGPNNTRPYPEDTPVDIDGIKGARITYEVQNSGGSNKDYTVLGQNYQVWNGMTSYIEEGTASWYGPGFNGKKTSLGEKYNQKGYSAAHKNLPLPSYLKVTNLENGKKTIVRVNDRGPFHGGRIVDLSEGAARHLGIIGKGTAKVRIEYLNVVPGGSVQNASGSAIAMGTSSAPAGSAWSGASGTSGNAAPWGAYSSAAASHSYTAAGGQSYAAVQQAGPVKYYTSTTPGTYVQMVATGNLQKAEEIRSMMQRRLGVAVRILSENGVNRVLAGPFSSESSARHMLEKARSQGCGDSFIKRF